jgi:hypothetical protein
MRRHSSGNMLNPFKAIQEEYKRMRKLYGSKAARFVTARKIARLRKARETEETERKRIAAIVDAIPEGEVIRPAPPPEEADTNVQKLLGQKQEVKKVYE